MRIEWNTICQTHIPHVTSPILKFGAFISQITVRIIKASKQTKRSAWPNSRNWKVGHSWIIQQLGHQQILLICRFSLLSQLWHYAFFLLTFFCRGGPKGTRFIVLNKEPAFLPSILIFEPTNGGLTSEKLTSTHKNKQLTAWIIYCSHE